MVGDTLHPRGIYVGDYDTKIEALKALMLAYRSSEHCDYPEEISDNGEFIKG